MWIKFRTGRGKHMKKFLSIFLTAALLLIAVPSVMANGEIQVALDGQKIQFDIPAQLINDRTMVPLRAIFEALGATVNWDSDTQTVTSTKDDTTVSLTIDSPAMIVNGKEVTLDAPACIVDGRTLVPVRAVSEAFSIGVKWDDTTKTVLLSTTGEFVEPTVTMYALDGRTLEVAQSQVDAYKEVGWYTEPVITMYALDGRTEIVPQSQVSAWQSVGWYTEPVVTMYALDGRTEIVPQSQVNDWKNVGWYDAPIFTKASFLSKANGWWVDLSSCREMWDGAYVLDFIEFKSDQVEFGTTHSEAFTYQLKKLTFKGDKTYSATLYSPALWYGDEYYPAEDIPGTIIYDGGNTLSINFGVEWYTYTYMGTGYDYNTIQTHPLVAESAKK